MGARRATAHWADHAIFWHLYPLGFVGAEQQALPAGAVPLHRLQKLEAWLDYAVELGCSALQLGPIFASETHGYDTVDHLRIDPRLGDDADFDRLVAALRGKGLKLVLDGVFNHVGRSFAQFADVQANGERSRYARWFRKTEKDYATFEGHGSLVALNHGEPEVAAYVSGAMQHWLDRGADGFRLDAAYAVPNAFWRDVLPGLRQKHPDAWFVGEVIHGDYVKVVAESGLDSLTQYELWKSIWSAINDENFFELAWTLERHRALLEQFVPMTFVGNHDVTRIASKLKKPEHLPHALVALLTLPGVPSIYAGDEQAFRGIKEERAGGDDAIRPAFPAAPSELAAYGWPTYRLHQNLIGLRRRNAWLQSAELHVEQKQNRSLIYTCRGPNGASLTVALNLSAETIALSWPARHVLSSGSTQPGSGYERAAVEPHGWLVCERAADSG